ncbi:unnamed protein product [Darwinula stevensoni]|uniref:TLC domain-containing protein n=1 Tax=Darwinula stevensoni TaxID=69355 RepID=A0A7R9ABW7_9CRUS|nr:unnamed protein product [Darwinula stevensoni]CAG0899759.1 unnamed protein product [Darwinula stevensoni]
MTSGKTIRDPMEKLETLRRNIWNEKFWLPRNVTWEDMKSKPGRPMPEFHDLLYAFPISISFLLFRIIFDTCVAYSLTIAFCPLDSVSLASSVHNSCRLIMEPLARAKVQRVKTLDPCWQYRGNGTLNAGRKWIQRENGSLRNEKARLELRKIRETGSVAHSFVFLFGVWTMVDKPFLRNTDLCFVNLPNPVSWDVWWYYMLEFGFHISQSLMLPFDVKKNDFLAQLAHHVVTIGLMMGSWISGNTEVGSIVLLVHDCADVPLQCCKLLKYFKAPDPDPTARKLFMIFSATWILTRVIYFPLYVNISATKALLYLDIFYFINIVLVVLLWSLFLLHLYWTYKNLHDSRSEDEDSDEDNHIEKKKSN